MGIATGHRLIRACRGETVDRTPVWAMRQAGRWDPEFRKLRGDLSFFQFSENAELSAAASLCPRRFGVDAIILFYDITTLAIAMGQRFELVADRGPVPDQPVRSQADVDRLTSNPDVADCRHVFEILRLVRRELGGELPILVFAGAPFTLATYQIATGKDVDGTRAFLRDQPEVWRSLLEKTAAATVRFLSALLAEGADAYQLFDSWAGCLSREEYLRWAQPFHQRIFGDVAGDSILFVMDSPFVDLMAESGCRVVSVGKHHDLATLQRDYPDVTFQGNVDHELLIHGSTDEVAGATARCLAQGGGRRHILNLDHGMDRSAKMDNFETFIRMTRMGNQH